MSSIVGHLLAGTSCHLLLLQRETPRPAGRWMLALLLAIAADFDYLPAWCCGLKMVPRYSHSLGFSFGIGLLAWWLLRRSAGWRDDTMLLPLCLLAPLSHLLLDLLVGVQAKPVLWPLFAEPLVLPFGILPSAGALYWRNVLLWRNLLIELGVLLPAAILLLHSRLRLSRWESLFCLACCSMFAGWGWLLSR